MIATAPRATLVDTMKIVVVLSLVCLVMAGAARAADDDAPIEPERALVLTLKWEGDTAAVDKVDRVERAVSPQKGFAQLEPLFFELRDGEDNVHFSGSMKDPRDRGHSAPPAESGTSTLVIPDIAEARRLFIMKRESDAQGTKRKTMLEHTL